MLLPQVLSSLPVWQYFCALLLHAKLGNQYGYQRLQDQTCLRNLTEDKYIVPSNTSVLVCLQGISIDVVVDLLPPDSAMSTDIGGLCLAECCLQYML